MIVFRRDKLEKIRFRIPNALTHSVPDIVLGITNGGRIINQWSQGGITAGFWQGQFSYITN